MGTAILESEGGPGIGADAPSSLARTDQHVPGTDDAGPAWRARQPMASKRIPIATYRLQFSRQFTFRHAISLLPYLHALGVTHVYASPYLRARAGSLHGYDVVDHGSLQPEIGSERDFDEFSDALRELGMGQILDIVPNHMGVMRRDNAWWLDLLENGRASIYADYFDVDWEPRKDELRGKVLVPILADHYGVVLERGDLVPEFDAARGELGIAYFEHYFPIDPALYPMVLAGCRQRLHAHPGPDHPDVLAFDSLLTAFGHLPKRDRTDAESVVERARDKEVHKAALAALYARSTEVAARIRESVDSLRGRAGDAASWDALHRIVKAQAFRLAHWRVASHDINYRRFFDVNDLAALRMERPEVFEATHRKVLEWAAAGKIAGLRIDHVDGLYDPIGYLERLQAALDAAAGGGPPRQPHAGGRRQLGTYVVVEKILAPYERLNPEWAVHGTTGYGFSNVVNGLFVDGAADAKMRRLYRSFIGEPVEYEDILHRAKKLIMRASIAGELNVLASRLSRIALSDRRTCDFTFATLHEALAEVAAAFPVYRTYVRDGSASAEDRRYVAWAVRLARRARNADASALDFVGEMLLAERGTLYGAARHREILSFAMRFQQFTAALMAKSMEDTSFYRYNRLASLNEVGGDPSRFGNSVAAFHHECLDLCKHWPSTLLATSTHDNKRSEDVRTRIDVLTEVPAQWKLHLGRWARLYRARKSTLHIGPVVSRNDEFLLYQTLIGTWPDVPMDPGERETYRERIEAYMLKIAREAKVRTSWLNPDPDYEQALLDLVRRLLTGPAAERFLADFVPFQAEVSRIGMLNSLSQLAIKMTAPGVPDIYQGNELWDLSLVDPDNRRGIDFDSRCRLLAGMRRCAGEAGPRLADYARSLCESAVDGRVKMYTTWRALGVRRQLPRVFLEGDYAPLRTHGVHAERLCVFARSGPEGQVITIAPRLWTKVAGGPVVRWAELDWGNTTAECPKGMTVRSYVHALTGETIVPVRSGRRLAIPVAQALRNFPVAILASGTVAGG